MISSLNNTLTNSWSCLFTRIVELSFFYCSNSRYFVMKSKISFILVFILVFLQITPVYAAVATGSNAAVASSSNADEIIEEEIEIDDCESMYESLLAFSSMPLASASDADYGIMLMSDGDAPTYYESTVSFDDVVVEFYYTDFDNVSHMYSPSIRSDGTFVIPYEEVGDFQVGYEIPFDYRPYIKVIVNRGSLPPSGSYQMSVSFGSEVGGMTYQFAILNCVKSIANSTSTSFSASDVSFVQLYGDYSFTKSIEFSNLSYVAYRLTFYDNFGAPYGGKLSIRFEPISTGTADLTQDSVPDSYVISDISSSTNAIYDTLRDLIQHISDQLAALWDQMYNLMHLPQLANDDKNTQLIVDTLQDGLSVEIENQDDNTEEILHGYDQSGIDDANDSLNSSIAEYSEAEKDVLDSVNENLNDFEFEESFDAYVSTIGTVSDFLQRMYESSGSLKDVINIGFFLSIAGIVIGLYRFKEG